MPRWAPLASFAIISPLLFAGCGASAPTEETIYYDPALRPGVVEAATESEQQLLIRLSEVSAGAPMEVGGQVFVADPLYVSASGRRCRTVHARGGEDGARLACETEDGWVFVPQVFEEVP